METLFEERLERIPADANAPLSALAIIKAFFPCDSAFFARAEAGGVFAAYASHGLESFIERGSAEGPAPAIRIPFPREPIQSYPVAELGLSDPAGETKAIVFSLGDNAPTDDFVLALLLRNVDESANGAIYRAVRKNGAKFRPKAAQAALASAAAASEPAAEPPASEPPIPEPSLDDAKREIGDALEARGGSGELIAFGFPALAPDLLRSVLVPAIEECVGDHGTVVVLPGARILVALKRGIDRDLFAHHIMKAAKKSAPDGVEISIVGTLSADSVQDALDFLDSAL